jgi:hypothetical protein
MFRQRVFQIGKIELAVQAGLAIKNPPSGPLHHFCQRSRDSTGRDQKGSKLHILFYNNFS